MPRRTSTTGSELFIVDNSDEDWKVLRYLHDWCQISKAIDCATGYFEVGSLLALKNEWQKVDQLRILMGDEVSHRTKNAFVEGLRKVTTRLDRSLEAEKQKNDFLAGVPAIVEAIRSGKIACGHRRRRMLPLRQERRAIFKRSEVGRERVAVRHIRLGKLAHPGATEI